MAIFKSLRLRVPDFLKGGLARTHQMGIPGGLSGNLKTIRVMREVARKRATHPLVRRTALAVLRASGVQDHDYPGEAVALGRWVQSRIRYVKDPTGVEQLTDPVTMLERISRGVAQGDCDDMALTLAALLLAAGHEPYFRAVRYSTESGPYNHIYVVVHENDLQGNDYRIPLDCIIKDQPMGFEVSHESGKEYLV